MTLTPAALALATGAASGAALIIALGAQNLFVLRQGVRREHAGAVVAVCVLSDVALIAVGAAGLGAIVQDQAWATSIARIGGGLFLVGYAVTAARRALRPSLSGSSAAAVSEPPPGLRPVVATCLALTWLNPHVYLDTVVLLGAMSSTHGEQRWWFAAGAMLASLAWFSVLAVGARALAPVLGRPGASRALDGVVAAVMGALGASLLVGAW